jgi:hypothetical protein
MQRTETTSRGFSPIFDELHATPGFGGQVDWSRVPDSFASGKFTIQVTEPAAIGEEELTVAALKHALKQGDILRAPDVPTVLVTLSANEAIGQTDISVLALPEALPSGAVLNFGVNEQMVLTAPAAKDAVLIVVEPLDTAVESGDTATYQGGEHNIEVTADAAEGATTVAVAELQFALADNTELQGDYTRSDDGRFIPIGTHISRTEDGFIIPRSAYDGDLNDVKVAEIMQSDAWEKSKSAAKSGYGTYSQALVYENLMPDADTNGDLPSAFKTELAAGGFKFTDYIDSRVS